MCRHIACGVVLLVFVVFFNDLLNVFVLFVLFFIIKRFARQP